MMIQRTRLVLRPDASRVFFRPFGVNSPERITRILSRVMALDEAQAEAECHAVMEDFERRHIHLRKFLLERAEHLQPYRITDEPMSEVRRILLGAYFTNEYALEAAALFNPSIVRHHDQGGLPPGALRFILSLRAVGEGHLSSIVFRTGVIDGDGAISVDEPSRYVTAAGVVPDALYDKPLFERKLEELGRLDTFASGVLSRLETAFTLPQLDREIALSLRRDRRAGNDSGATAQTMRALARSNYEISFDPTTAFSERVIFPVTEAEARGIEDARFVHFHEEDGTSIYYATYTAYDGRVVLPQLLETRDFLHFRIITLNGPEVQNKGFALFPRRIAGRYAMLSRQDNENIYLMFSDSLHFWYDKHVLLRPTEPWEFVQLGNCGSPIETEAGWLVLTHGVGPMRRYTISAILLDLDDPTRVIGRLRRPLIEPAENEREGYVPNVVYSCGALVHARRLILPYAMSDQCATFATVPLEELLQELLAQPPKKLS